MMRGSLIWLNCGQPALAGGLSSSTRQQTAAGAPSFPAPCRRLSAGSTALTLGRKRNATLPIAGDVFFPGNVNPRIDGNGVNGGTHYSAPGSAQHWPSASGSALSSQNTYSLQPSNSGAGVSDFDVVHEPTIVGNRATSRAVRQRCALIINLVLNLCLFQCTNAAGTLLRGAPTPLLCRATCSCWSRYCELS